jgi:hypothetical protein
MFKDKVYAHKPVIPEYHALTHKEVDEMIDDIYDCDAFERNFEGYSEDDLIEQINNRIGSNWEVVDTEAK